MTRNEERMFARYEQVPREIIQRAHRDAYIHAGLTQWIDTEESVEQLLVRLVLLLSEQNEKQFEAMRQALMTGRPSSP